MRMLLSFVENKMQNDEIKITFGFPVGYEGFEF